MYSLTIYRCISHFTNHLFACLFIHLFTYFSIYNNNIFNKWIQWIYYFPGALFGFETALHWCVTHGSEEEAKILLDYVKVWILKKMWLLLILQVNYIIIIHLIINLFRISFSVHLFPYCYFHIFYTILWFLCFYFLIISLLSFYLFCVFRKEVVTVWERYGS